MSDEIIDESNFHDFFHDIRHHKPRRGQVLARYTAMADLVDGVIKNFLVNTLLNCEKGADMASQVMKYHCHATDEYANKVPLEMAKDLNHGMTTEEVKKKPYRFQIEYFYWTDQDNIPKDDLHWECITITKSELEWADAQLELEDMEQKEREANEKIQDNG